MKKIILGAAVAALLALPVAPAHTTPRLTCTNASGPLAPQICQACAQAGTCGPGDGQAGPAQQPPAAPAQAPTCNGVALGPNQSCGGNGEIIGPPGNTPQPPQGVSCNGVALGPNQSCGGNGEIIGPPGNTPQPPQGVSCNGVALGPNQSCGGNGEIIGPPGR
jgi:hypothetical protein